MQFCRRQWNKSSAELWAWWVPARGPRLRKSNPHFYLKKNFYLGVMKFINESKTRLSLMSTALMVCPIMNSVTKCCHVVVMEQWCPHRPWWWTLTIHMTYAASGPVPHGDTKALLLLTQDSTWSCSHQQGLLFIASHTPIYHLCVLTVPTMWSLCPHVTCHSEPRNCTIEPFGSRSTSYWVNVGRSSPPTAGPHTGFYYTEAISHYADTHPALH